jgi:hypothetical protein
LGVGLDRFFNLSGSFNSTFQLFIRAGGFASTWATNKSSASVQDEYREYGQRNANSPSA